jgi:hypothetical protein
MIELQDDALLFSFPDVHQDARITIDFQRTLRIPDDGGEYLLPPGLGSFPLRHVDDYAAGMPSAWIAHGGVMLPMYQSEAMWLYFTPHHVMDRATSYPFAIKIATGKMNAVSGDEWTPGLHRDPQDYVVAPDQPWLDGYCVEKGFIRQFVAMPLGAGYSAEEQLTGEAKHGGLQIAVFPMKREVYERRFPKIDLDRDGIYPAAMGLSESCMIGAMGLAAGGRMRQEIYADSFDLADWDLESTSRCFVHIANSMVWRAVTGENPPTTPPTAKEYTQLGLPWFDYYDSDATALDGAAKLGRMKSIVEMGKKKGDVPLPENESITPEKIVQIRKSLKKGQVREGTF